MRHTRYCWLREARFDTDTSYISLMASACERFAMSARDASRDRRRVEGGAAPLQLDAAVRYARRGVKRAQQRVASISMMNDDERADT